MQTPAGDVPMRSISLAFDGSCLVAGNNEVGLLLDSRLAAILAGI